MSFSEIKKYINFNVNYEINDLNYSFSIYQDNLLKFAWYQYSQCLSFLQEGKEKITMDNLRNVCIKYRLPVDAEILDRVFDYCDEDKDGMISYLEFANFLNWKEKLPTGLDDLGCKFSFL